MIFSLSLTSFAKKTHVYANSTLNIIYIRVWGGWGCPYFVCAGVLLFYYGWHAPSVFPPHHPISPISLRESRSPESEEDKASSAHTQIIGQDGQDEIVAYRVAAERREFENSFLGSRGDVINISPTRVTFSENPS